LSTLQQALPGQHEACPAEHLPLDRQRMTCQSFTHTLGQVFVKGHVSVSGSSKGSWLGFYGN
jgi:hypothetical protein